MRSEIEIWTCDHCQQQIFNQIPKNWTYSNMNKITHYCEKCSPTLSENMRLVKMSTVKDIFKQKKQQKKQSILDIG